MSGFSRGVSQSGALMSVSGEWSNALPLREMISIYEAGSPMDLTDLEFEFTLRRSRVDTATCLSATTDSGLVVATVQNDAGDDVDVLQFDDVDISSLCGDYIADFTMKDASGNYTHLAHGVVSVWNDPVSPTI